MTSVCFWFQVLQMFLILFGMHTPETLESSSLFVTAVPTWWSDGSHLLGTAFPEAAPLTSHQGLWVRDLGETLVWWGALWQVKASFWECMWSHREHLECLDPRQGKFASLWRREASYPAG